MSVTLELRNTCFEYFFRFFFLKIAITCDNNEVKIFSHLWQQLSHHQRKEVYCAAALTLDLFLHYSLLLLQLSHAQDEEDYFDKQKKRKTSQGEAGSCQTRECSLASRPLPHPPCRLRLHLKPPPCHHPHPTTLPPPAATTLITCYDIIA